MEKGFYKKYARVGPGGKKCSCCYPAPGKYRRFLERLYKRQFNKADREFDLNIWEDDRLSSVTDKVMSIQQMNKV